MNITDVDDKIILAARQQHLLSQWLERHASVDQDVQNTTKRAFESYLEKHLPLISHMILPETFDEESARAYSHVMQGQSVNKDGSPPGDKEAKLKMHLNTARSAAEAFESLQLDEDNEVSIQDFGLKSAGVLLPYIDAQQKHTVQGKDHEIFTKLTKRYEQRFFEDMKSLNVQYPDKLTRVTEYGPQIVDFVKQIQDNGYGYDHEGSVYYDTHAWESSGGVYARLQPWNRNDKELQADGEGSLSAKTTSFKRSGADFALWKASKEGEPSWSSPWGEGRPGWHIECSAMASDILGKQFDMHSGGIDLAFPHHDNELAQSEAYWTKTGKQGEQWVNYFLHMGHLSIQGSKMSKSLKNFTTIREAISKGDWTPRSLRIVFLLGAWKDGLEITGEVVKAGVAWEDRVNNFFIRVLDVERNLQPTSSPNYVNGHAGMNGLSDKLQKSMSETALSDQSDDGGIGLCPESRLEKQLKSSQQAFHNALCDSFDTPTAMRVISDLITAYNTEKRMPQSVSMDLGRWITEVVVMFGLDASYREGQMGWSGIDIPLEAKPFIYPLATLRDGVREQAKAGQIVLSELGRFDEKSNKYPDTQPYANAQANFERRILALHDQGASPKDYLAACDYVRDTVLWDLGIYLEDRENQSALVRPLSSSLREERRDREAAASSKAAAKAKAKADADAAEREKLNKGQLSHLQMFRTSEYSAWDAEGLPTHDSAGTEVAKSRSKKLRKDWERQKKLHEQWQASNTAAPAAQQS